MYFSFKRGHYDSFPVFTFIKCQLTLNIEIFKSRLGCLLWKDGKIWIWNLTWIKFGLNLKVLKRFLKKCLGSPCYLMVLSRGSFSLRGLNKDSRRCFLRGLQVSSSSSLFSTLPTIDIWVKIYSFLLLVLKTPPLKVTYQ